MPKRARTSRAWFRRTATTNDETPPVATLTRPQPMPRVRAAWPRLPLLDGYLLREMVGPFLFAFGAFLLFWALNIFFLAADYIINQHAPFFLVLRFVVFRIPQAIPMAFLFACLFA